MAFLIFYWLIPRQSDQSQLVILLGSIFALSPRTWEEGIPFLLRFTHDQLTAVLVQAGGCSKFKLNVNCASSWHCY